jgi:hypothetical protein
MIPIRKKTFLIVNLINKIKKEKLRSEYKSIDNLFKSLENFYSNGYHRGDPSKLFISSIKSIIIDVMSKKEESLI